ncbi:LytR/AlgR family response regulator transcription factor [Roseburia sp. 1XD42-69]|uniref:LytR/AlgR family response regulator transcription factor n=1 Tax=Roseburia sp. 1XD42-69 TaxID=2320088 RepID=UPI000EA23558|nr:LytTR family DNA-binding domain-containing protein [Roseburia sp. 1XD42-69]RKJ60792.1 DNA-binding response regulator [Roseburia sp. 1XD42-69]
MNIALVDDEEAIREQIGGFIKKRNPDFDISGFDTGEGLLAAGKDFDIIFLDIQMEGMGGIEAARTLRQSGVDAVVIFITGIREYVFEAFDVSAFHYLLKPIEEQKFMEVLGRAAEEAGKRKGQREKQIFIRAKNQGYTLNLNSILYIESRGKKVEIKLESDGKAAFSGKTVSIEAASSLKGSSSGMLSLEGKPVKLG